MLHLLMFVLGSKINSCFLFVEMNSSIVSSIIVSMRKVRLNRANPGQDNLFLRNRYFLYIEK